MKIIVRESQKETDSERERYCREQGKIRKRDGETERSRRGRE